ncbi:MAG: polysaccharide biosynthesis protein [Dorea sp.]|nr:polysaccharide biosynthesis protein [Dorea sp.]
MNILRRMNRKKAIRRFFLIVLDSVIIFMACFLALATRFEFVIQTDFRWFAPVLLKYQILFIPETILVFYLFHLYHSLWEYTGLDEIINIGVASIFSGIVEIVTVLVVQKHLPRGYYILYIFYCFGLISFSRLAYRSMRLKSRNKNLPWKNARRVMLIGAGEAGRTVMSEIQNSRYLNQKVCCLIDDDPNKIGNYLNGVRVYGNRTKIKDAVEKYDIQLIMITMPSQSRKQIRPILDICKETGCEIKILPGIYQLVNNEVHVNKLRPVSIEDLLGRDEIHINLDEIMGYVSDKVVMVTGGGGSIGSELCRQLAARSPKQLIIFDIYENNAYEIQQELLRSHPELPLVVLIGSVRDEKRLDSVFEKYRPDIVYHAAAHKHVPLMENSPNEAIKNNVIGTLNVTKMADRYKVKRFVQISTDKAVNPTNIMGASKRMCEMIIQTYNKHSDTEFVAVRFGNVLGSNGSVIPLFKKQIEEGGPVTVTHPEIIRYFMTIPEAVSLVLQAGAYAKGGEIFVLDMGEPVKILDLAKHMIELSGLTVDKDIAIEFTGLRPGEKLYEELLMDEEGMTDTPNNLIHIGKPIEVDEDELNQALNLLDQASHEEAENIKKLVASIVPTYQPQ